MKLKAAFLRLLGYCKWDIVEQGDQFVWRRYDPDSDSWQIRQMTQDEAWEAMATWAVK